MTYKNHQIWQKMKKSLLPLNSFLYSLRRSKFFFIFCQIFLIVIYCCHFCRIQYNNCCIAVENVFNSKFGYSIHEHQIVCAKTNLVTQQQDRTSYNSEHHILVQNWTSNMSNITKNKTVCEHLTVRSKTTTYPLNGGGCNVKLMIFVTVEWGDEMRPIHRCQRILFQ